MTCCTAPATTAHDERSRLTPRLPAAHPVLAEHERQRCEIWTRVMGYHRPVSSFNTGKQGEFHDRRYFVAEARGADERLA